VHGALMMISFAVLLPAALLTARHKWLFIDQEHVSAAASATLTEQHGRWQTLGMPGAAAERLTLAPLAAECTCDPAAIRARSRANICSYFSTAASDACRSSPPLLRFGPFFECRVVASAHCGHLLTWCCSSWVPPPGLLA
jgi:hypothetical protein